MPRIAYIKKRFNRNSLAVIKIANEIIKDYQSQGFVITLRQLYYQFVAHHDYPNNLKSYKRLGSIINDARLAGLIGWLGMEDRTRQVWSVPHWGSPQEIVEGCVQQFRIDKWEGQTYRPEVWIEKEALAGVVEGVCGELDIPFLSCRGYTSQSEMWKSAMRLRKLFADDQVPYILHFGDHDPSGIDMTRDIQDRLKLFIGLSVEFKRVALNMYQVEEHKLPPNPAKQTDSRYSSYVAEYGEDSYELDALAPSVITYYIRSLVIAVRDEKKWAEKVREENEHRRWLQKVSELWDRITDEL